MKPFATLDFETEAIARRPMYPPKAVGVSVKNPGERKFTYYAWGHPTKNNCTRSKAEQVLKGLWRSGLPIVTMHGKFDFDVAETDFNLPRLPWERMEDIEYLLFLDFPHARQLALKPSAERLLGMPPEERDELKEWILANVPNVKPSEWGAYICKAPGDLVGRYANGDGTRTEKLFRKLMPSIIERGMLDAYNRERKLMPILLDTEREGLRCDLKKLEDDFSMYSQALENAQNWLRKKLKAPDLEFTQAMDVANVLDREGIITDWVWTKGGKNKAPQKSTAKDNMTLAMFTNRKIALVYGYQARLRTCISTFMIPGLEMARQSDGFIYTNWNQVRQDHGGDNVGTRTGRLSSNPNFQNISKDFEDKDDGYENPDFLLQYPTFKRTVERVVQMGLGFEAEEGFKQLSRAARKKLKTEIVEIKEPAFKAYLPPLPLMRRYILPDKGCTWGHRDYNQQELRLLAHFEDGELCAKYNEKPYYNPDGSFRFDIHAEVREAITNITGFAISRGGTKIVNFADIYGRGLTQLAIKLDVSRKMATDIKAAKDAFMPGIPTLSDNIKFRGRSGECITTWGGRQYFTEERKFVKKFKRVMDFEYKLLNYLIQGSSADVTKEAVIRYHNHPKRQARFMLTVHDEINSSMPDKRLREEMKILREVMESIEADVPMLSDGKTGKNWGARSAANPNGIAKYKEN